jgi:hypothetical protein
VSEIRVPQTNGAKSIVVHGLGRSGPWIPFYTSTFWQWRGVKFTPVDIAAMIAEVEADPTAYGFIAATVLPERIGQRYRVGVRITGWRLIDNFWLGPMVRRHNHPSSSYAYLRSASAEQTSFYADNEHFSAAGLLLRLTTCSPK